MSQEKKRNLLVLVIEILSVLFLCAAGIGGAHLWKQGPAPFSSFALLLVIPAMAATLLFCTVCVVPDLLAGDRIGFPVTITFPILYNSFIIALLILFTRLGVGIAKTPDALKPIYVWSVGWVIAVNLIAGTVALVAVGALAKERQSDR